MAPHSELPLLISSALRNARLKAIPAGQIILYEGDLPSDVLVIKSGIVKIYDIDDQGNEKILHFAKAPAVIPMSYFSGMHDPLRWFYASVTDCEVYVVEFSKFHKLMRTHADVAEMLTNNFSDDVHELLVRLSSLGKTNSQDKVVAALKFLVARHATERRADWWRVTFPVNHQLIADICGITRESTALVMKELLDNKVIRSPKLTVLEINRKKLTS